MLELDDREIMVLSTGFEPLYRTHWRRAIVDVVVGRAEAVEYFDDVWIGTAQGPLEVPSKIRMLTGVIKAHVRKRTFASHCYPSKKAIWLRDGGQCQYCDVKITVSSATMDHVIPRSRGGRSDWTNLVASCHDCNQRKGARTPEESNMPLRSKPSRPWDYVSFVK